MKHSGKTGIAFLGYNYPFWIGGINYIRNLIMAINAADSKEYFPVVFFERNAEESVKNVFNNISETITFNINNPELFSRKAWVKLRKDNSYLRYYFEKYNIGIVSHSVIDFSFLNVKRISWLPDFQHVHYPDNFSTIEVEARNNSFKERIINSDLTVVSSNCAMNDLENFCSGYRHRVAVLHFTAWVDHQKLLMLQDSYVALKNRFGIERDYFFLPNQFWKHKNHKVVFEAINIIKGRNKNILVICTGNLKSTGGDDSNTNDLIKLINENNLHGNICILGLIDEPDMLCLMRNAIAVINPSKFEGWSTTVEECKSMGKTILLSDIPVHKEQAPPTGLFFNPDDPEELANLMEETMRSSDKKLDKEMEERAKELLPSRMNKFGNEYLGMVDQLNRVK